VNVFVAGKRSTTGIAEKWQHAQFDLRVVGRQQTQPLARDKGDGISRLLVRTGCFAVRVARAQPAVAVTTD